MQSETNEVLKLKADSNNDCEKDEAVQVEQTTLNDDNTPQKVLIKIPKEKVKRNPALGILQKTLCLLIAATFFLGLTGFTAKCEDIEQKVLRLHILANSDSEEDQALKLKVRDAVLAVSGDIFDGAETASDAEEKVKSNSLALINAAQEVIKAEGYDYNVSIEITDTVFPTKTYEDVTLPAGTYRAVRIIIGEGEGHNWWCVMFPSLCLPGASSRDGIDAVLTDGETQLVESDPEIDIRFKIAEVLSDFDIITKIFA